MSIITHYKVRPKYIAWRSDARIESERSNTSTRRSMVSAKPHALACAAAYRFVDHGLAFTR